MAPKEVIPETKSMSWPHHKTAIAAQALLQNVTQLYLVGDLDPCADEDSDSLAGDDGDEVDILAGKSDIGGADVEVDDVEIAPSGQQTLNMKWRTSKAKPITFDNDSDEGELLFRFSPIILTSKNSESFDITFEVNNIINDIHIILILSSMISWNDFHHKVAEVLNVFLDSLCLKY